MKRVLFALLVILMSFACFAEDVVIAPFSGVFGVNIASMLYRGGTNWACSSLKDPAFSNPEEQYTDDHIVATAGVYNAGNNPDASYTITVSCPNGLYFRSQSNPNYIRPFHLLVLPRFEDAAGGQDFSGKAKILTASGDTFKVTYRDEDDPKTPKYGNLWCDIILVLPLDVDSSNNPISVAGTNYITYNNRQYPLAQAEDYTALVTLTITSNTGKSDSIVIPFSGYYNGLPESDKGDQLISLMFTPSGNAANLNIVSDANKAVQVGHIDLLLDATSNNGNPINGGGYDLHSDDYVKLFLSSSNSPYDTAAGEFAFVHSSVGPSTVLTNYNSIGYEITVTGQEQGGQGFVRFDGTDHLSGDFDISNAIIPIHTIEDRIPVIDNRIREYYEYHGDINVIIDTPAGTMLPGRYSSVVYMHVVTEAPANAGITT